MYQIDPEDMQLFNRLKKMIDSAIKMECSGCHKLIPTTKFYEHLNVEFNDE
jgi:predicted aldo/keto reductase-like oxidoreductase